MTRPKEKGEHENVGPGRENAAEWPMILFAGMLVSQAEQRIMLAGSLPPIDLKG